MLTLDWLWGCPQALIQRRHVSSVRVGLAIGTKQTPSQNWGNLLSELHVPHKQCLTSISDAFSASFTSIWPAFLQFHPQQKHAYSALHPQAWTYIYIQVYARRHLPSAVPWISEDRLFCPWNSPIRFPSGPSWIFLWMEFNNKFAHVENCTILSGTTTATKKNVTDDKSSHVHIRRFNIVNNHVDIICNYVLLTQVSRWKQHEMNIITIMVTNYVKIMTNYVKIMTDYVSRRPDIPALVDWA